MKNYKPPILTTIYYGVGGLCFAVAIVFLLMGLTDAGRIAIQVDVSAPPSHEFLYAGIYTASGLMSVGIAQLVNLIGRIAHNTARTADATEKNRAEYFQDVGSPE